MARQWTDGAEMGDKLFWDWESGGDFIIDTQYPASGVYAYRAYYSGTGGYKNFVTPVAEFYLKFRMRLGPAGYFPYGNGAFPMMLSGGTNIAWLAFEQTTNYFCAYVNNTKVAQYTTLLNSNQYYLFEIHYKMADAGVFQTKIDGILAHDYSGDTKPGAQTVMDRIRWYPGGDYCSPHQYMYLDDIALNDTTGDVDNSWCGGGRIEALRVNADGDVLQWTPSAGNHWDCVDEVPSNSDTDFVHSKDAGKQDMFNLAAFTDTNKTVDRIWVEGRAKDFSATASMMKLGVKTSGSVFLGGYKTLPASYIPVRSPELLVDPTSQKVWTKTELDALQIVIESE